MQLPTLMLKAKYGLYCCKYNKALFELSFHIKKRVFEMLNTVNKLKKQTKQHKQCQSLSERKYTTSLVAQSAHFIHENAHYQVRMQVKVKLRRTWKDWKTLPWNTIQLSTHLTALPAHTQHENVRNACMYCCLSVSQWVTLLKLCHCVCVNVIRPRVSRKVAFFLLICCISKGFSRC